MIGNRQYLKSWFNFGHRAATYLKSVCLDSFFGVLLFTPAIFKLKACSVYYKILQEQHNKKQGIFGSHGRKFSVAIKSFMLYVADIHPAINSKCLQGLEPKMNE